MIATLLHQAGGSRGREGGMRSDRECMKWKGSGRNETSMSSTNTRAKIL
jgi:hypothetical protein